MACGTGKTLMGAFAARTMWEAETAAGVDGRAGRDLSAVLVVVPNLGLVHQTAQAWEQVFPQLQWWAVCSDTTVNSYGRELESTVDSTVFSMLHDTDRVLADARDIRAALVDRQYRSQPRLLISTYQSCDKVAQAFAAGPGLRPFGLLMLDEAHHCAPHHNHDSCFTMPLDAQAVPARRRLACTATPRPDMFSSDLFGPLAYTLTFAQAVQRHILCPYRAVVLAISHSELASYLAEHRSGRARQNVPDIAELVRTGALIKFRDGGVTHTMDAQELTAHIATSKVMAEHHLSRAVVFHNTMRRSRRWAQQHTRVVRQLPAQFRRGTSEALGITHINGNQSVRNRERKLEILAQLQDDQGQHLEAMLVCNVNCLHEGIDVAALDLVVLAEMRRSPEQLAQLIGRVMRRDANNPDKVGYILVPVLVTDAELADPERFAQSEAGQQASLIIQALSLHDADLAEEQRQAAIQQGARLEGWIGTIKGLGAATPIWELHGRVIRRSATSTEPEIWLSATTADGAGTVEIRGHLAARQLQPLANRSGKTVLARPVDPAAWASALQLRVMGNDRNGWWVRYGQIVGILEKAKAKTEKAHDLEPAGV